MNKTDLAIIGAGPGGLAAAVAAAKAELRVTLIDENPRPGGQYLRGAASANPASTERRGRALLRQISSLGIAIQSGTLVWNIEGHVLSLHSSKGTAHLEAQSIIAATGARECVHPFPGWTLPGVMTLGAAQILAKEQNTLPGKRILLAGTGPLLLAAASQLLGKGATIAGVLDAAPALRWLKLAASPLAAATRIPEGWQYLKTLRHHRMKIRFGEIVIRAQGNHQLESVTTARLDHTGKPIPGSEREIPVDTVCINDGFTPNTEFTRLAGCQHEYDAQRGGWVPNTTAYCETSIPYLFAVGECNGVAGASAALLEGQIAGLTVACQNKRMSISEFTRLRRPLQRRLRTQRHFGRRLNALFFYTSTALLKNETILCRCQEITAGAVRQAIQSGGNTLDALKNQLDVGQGLCQGRMCGPQIAELIAAQNGVPIAQAGYFNPRPPLKPVPLCDLAEEQT